MNPLLDLLKGFKDKLSNIEKQVNSENIAEAIAEQSRKNVEEKLEDYLATKDQVVDLNIGGKIFKTKEETLLNHEGSLFSTVITKYKEEGNPTRELFFDRSPSNFYIILNYLRTGKVEHPRMDKLRKEELNKEFEYYGLSNAFKSKSNKMIDIGWDPVLSKAGMCSVDSDDNRKIKIHSTTCYTHFLTNRTFSEENFVIEMESTVTQTDNYFYFGIINETYNTTSSCFCCNPANAFYIKCDGKVTLNGRTTDYLQMAWHESPITITMKIDLVEKNILFSILEKGEIGPFPINGTTFRVVAAHCNTGNGTIIINDCHEI